LRTDDFDYDLPTGLIAQKPAVPRDSCRLLVLDRSTGQIDHATFSDLPDYLHAGDVVVVNDTRVLPARLHGVKDETGGVVEVLLLRERYENAWECLVKPGRRLRPGARIVFADGAMTGLVVDQIDQGGGRVIQFRMAGAETFLDVVHRIGQMPLPPYIAREIAAPELYQTVFSREERSAAAPTAGLHFTPELLDRVRETGARVETVELDVGIDTFRPVSEDDPADHHIHTEHFRVGRYTADSVNAARERGARVIAVGTTSVRALESAWDRDSGLVEETQGATSLFILPGYQFGVVDAMVTNFHVPRSTLLMMVSAFAGHGSVFRAYEIAKESGYRFLSFGDAMLIT
jgi:S-adenosylmethionine:tRNA ribosyltransferase-isomerase